MAYRCYDTFVAAMVPKFASGGKVSPVGALAGFTLFTVLVNVLDSTYNVLFYIAALILGGTLVMMSKELTRLMKGRPLFGTAAGSLELDLQSELARRSASLVEASGTA